VDVLVGGLAAVVVAFMVSRVIGEVGAWRVVGRWVVSRSWSDIWYAC
jgi:hypothetical protein